MPIDPQIALQSQAPNPLGILAKYQAVKQQQLQQQGTQQDLDMGQLKLNQANQSAQDDTDQRAAYAAAVDPQTGKVDNSLLISTLGKLNPTLAAKTATSLNAQDQAAQEAKAKLTQAQVQAAQAHIDLKDKLLQGVNDQISYTNARNIALQNGVNPQEMPPQYDPQFVAQAHAQTLSQKAMLDQHLKDRESDRADQTQAETEDNNAALRDQAQQTAIEQAARDKEAARHNRASEGLEASKVGIERQKLQQSAGNPQLAAQLLVNGDATLSELKARGSTPEFIAQTLNAAHAMTGGKYNAQQEDASFSVAKSPANVGFFGSAKSLTDKGGTLDQLAEAAKDIPGHQLPVFNTIADAEKAAAGSGPIAKYASIMLGVSDDYSKVMGGGNGSDTSRTQALHLVPTNASPEARAASIEGIRGAVSSQINSRIGNNRILKRMYGDAPATDAPPRPAGVPDGAKWNPQRNGGKGSWKL